MREYAAVHLSIISKHEIHNICFLFIELNASLYIAHGKLPDENSVLGHQGAVSKTQLQVKKHRTSKGEKFKSKYNYR